MDVKKYFEAFNGNKSYEVNNHNAEVIQQPVFIADDTQTVNTKTLKTPKVEVPVGLLEKLFSDDIIKTVERMLGTYNTKNLADPENVKEAVALAEYLTRNNNSRIKKSIVTTALGMAEIGLKELLYKTK